MRYPCLAVASDATEVQWLSRLRRGTAKLQIPNYLLSLMDLAKSGQLPFESGMVEHPWVYHERIGGKLFLRTLVWSGKLLSARGGGKLFHQI
jgi:hypothetical protein